MLKRKTIAVMMVFTLLGAGYFSSFSQLDINVFLKGYVAVVPLQLAALLYILYLRWSDRLPGTPDHLRNED